MPRYFFHLYNRIGDVLDEQGEDLAGLDPARAVAVGNIRSILAEDVRNGLFDLNGRIDIADGEGKVLATVRFSEAVQVKPEETR